MSQSKGWATAMCDLIALGDSLKRRTVNKRRELLKQHVSGWASAIMDLCSVRQQPEDFFLGLDQAIHELKRQKDRWEEML